MMKSKRQELIIEIVSNNEIETQEDLIEKLKQIGFDVTQATVSRDIRELKLVKVTTGHGGFKYVLPQKKENSINLHFNSAFTKSITSVDHSMNIVVIKTYPGLANAVATSIDSLDILGCVAGDDTIITVVRDENAAQVISDKIKDIIRSHE